MRDIIIFSGSSHPALAQSIADRLNLPLGKVEIGKFSNLETSVQIMESVRESDVYIIQTANPGHLSEKALQYMKETKGKDLLKQITRGSYENSVNDQLMELLIMISACKFGSAKKITVVLPLFPYARQPDVPYKKNLNHLKLNAETPQTSNSPTNSSSFHLVNNHNKYKHWVARSGTLVSNMLIAAGAQHVITMDLHDPQFQGFFDCPVDNLLGSPLIIKYIKEKVQDYKKAVIVSPDAGGAKRASHIANKLGMPFALIHKERKINHVSIASSPDQQHHTQEQQQQQHQSLNMMLVGEVKNKVCIMIDDIADTSLTITRAASLLKQHGASRIMAIVTHGILSGEAPIKLLESQCLDELVVSNTVPQEEHWMVLEGRLGVFDVSGLFAEAIRRVHHGESVSFLFAPIDYE